MSRFSPIAAFVAVCVLGTLLSPLDSVSAQPIEQILFPGKGHLKLSGDLRRPDGTGPFPAVIMMPGCNGIGGGEHPAMARVAKSLRDSGFVVLMFDSHVSRSVISNCADPALVCTPEARQPPGKRSPTIPERRIPSTERKVSSARPQHLPSAARPQCGPLPVRRES